MRNLSGINFNNVYRSNIVLVIRIYFDRNVVLLEVQTGGILIKEIIYSSRCPNLLNMFNINIISNAAADVQNIFFNMLSVFPLT